MSELAQCNRCGGSFPATIENFYKNVYGGLFLRCKACVKQERKAYKAENRDEVNRAQNARRQHRRFNERGYWESERAKGRERWSNRKDDPDVRARKREHNREYFQEHKDHLVAEKRGYLRQYHVERMKDPQQREKQREYGRQYARDNLEKMKAHTRNRRARLRDAEGTHTAADVLRILEVQGFRCFWCGDDLSGGRHTVDHYIPIIRGGSNGPENIVGACATCNYTKRDMMPDAFRRYRAETA